MTSMASTTRTGVYLRISRDTEGMGLGVTRQTEDCRALAETLGWEVVDTYVDNDRSAFKGTARPEYDRLCADLEAGRINGVIAWHPDRLHRSPKELEAYVDLVQRVGADTHTVRAGGWDLSTPAGRLQARVIGSFSRYESEHKSDRIARKHEQIALSGGYHGGHRPFGWEADGLTLRPDEAKVAADAIHAIINGHSVRAIIRRLNDSGSLTSTGREWTVTRLRNMLVRPRNAGLSISRGEVVGRGQWEPIVTEDEWRACLAILNDPTRLTAPAAGGRIRWLGSGLYRCGVCGSSKTRVSKGTNGKPAYRCAAQIQHGRAGGHITRAAEPIDTYVGALIVSRLSLPDAADLFAQPDYGPRVDEMRTERSGLDARLTEANDMFADGQIDRAALARITERIAPRLDELDTSLADMVTRSPVAALASADDVAEAWLVLDIDRKRAILDALLEVTIEKIGGGQRAVGRDGSRHDLDVRWKL